MSGERIPGADGFDRCELCGKLKAAHRPWHCAYCQTETVTAPEALAVVGLMAALYAWREWRADLSGYRRGLEVATVLVEIVTEAR